MLVNTRVIISIIVLAILWYLAFTYFDLKKFKDTVTLEIKYQERLNKQGAINAKATDKALKNIKYDGCDSNCTARL